MTVVVDASALLAYLKDEPGGEIVEGSLADSVISSVNWAEVVQKMIALGGDVDGLLQDFQETGMTVALFTIEDAEMTAQLWSETKALGLSLGDRACLSLGMRLEATVLTSDRAWESLDLPVQIQLIR